MGNLNFEASATAADRRLADRASCLIQAEIENAGSQPLPCTIWDMNALGAKILVGDIVVPDTITLCIPALSIAKCGYVRWRADGAIGVEFDKMESSQHTDREQILRLEKALLDLQRHVVTLEAQLKAHAEDDASQPVVHV